METTPPESADDVPVTSELPENVTDISSAMPLPDMEPNLFIIIIYTILFVIAAIGNSSVLISLCRTRHKSSRISMLIRHLAIADLIVTFIMIPIEVGWRLTVRWVAGNFGCKVFQFLRALGPYLSSNILVCISLDRYFAVLYPLRVNDARKRGKVMLTVAWVAAFIYCIPQLFVFSVMLHPRNPEYVQCVSFGFFAKPSHEIIYNFMCVMFMYFVPLIVIIVAYTAILCEISKNSQSSSGEGYRSGGRIRLRRSDISNIERARRRTLKMTIMIVAAYVWCCTPYVIITLWYMFDRQTAEGLPEWIQESFFMMVVSNSCVNPIVYGSYAVRRRRNCCYCFCFGCIRYLFGKENRATGSGRTKTTRAANIATKPPNAKNCDVLESILKKKNGERRSSGARVSFSEPSCSSSRDLKNSVHSEPLPHTYSLLEQQTIGLLTAGNTISEPNVRPSECTILEIHDFELYPPPDKKEKRKQHASTKEYIPLVVFNKIDEPGLALAK